MSTYDGAHNQHLLIARADGMYAGLRRSGHTSFSWTKIPGTSARDHDGWIAARANNSLIYVFQRAGSGTSPAGPYMQTRSATGTWSAAYRLPGTSDGTYYWNDAVLDADGYAHIVLQRYTGGTASGLYTVRGRPGSWPSRPSKVSGTTDADSGGLSIDTSRTKVVLIDSRYNVATDARATYLSIKRASSALFPALVKRSGLGSRDEVVDVSIYGTRVQLLVNRFISAGNANNGVFKQKATVTGTTSAPALSWVSGSATRVVGTGYRDQLASVATSTSGAVALGFYRGHAESDAGIYLLISSTTGVWGHTASRKSTTVFADYDYPAVVDFAGSVGYLLYARH